MNTINKETDRQLSVRGKNSHSPWRRAGASVLLFGLVLLLQCDQLSAQAPTTTSIQDTVYKSDGSLAKGSVVITWPPFISADGRSVFGGSKTVTINSGSLNVDLVPNEGATPSGTSYNAKYYQSGSVYSEEIWVVPSSGTPLTLSQVRVNVAPSPPVILSSTQVTGTAIVANPSATQTITAPSTAGVAPLRLKGNPTANANLLEIYDSQSTPQLQGRFDAAGALVLNQSPTLSTMSSGSVLFAGNGGQISQDNANLFWDDTDNRLLVGPQTISFSDPYDYGLAQNVFNSENIGAVDASGSALLGVSNASIMSTPATGVHGIATTSGTGGASRFYLSGVTGESFHESTLLLQQQYDYATAETSE